MLWAWKRIRFSRFQVQSWCWVLAFIVAIIALAIFHFSLLARGLLHAVLRPIFFDAMYVLIGLWALAGFVWRGCWIGVQTRKLRGQHLRLQRLNYGMNAGLNTVYMQLLQKHYGKRNRSA